MGRIFNKRICRKKQYNIYFSEIVEGMEFAPPRVFIDIRRKITCLTDGICFSGAPEASEYYGISNKAIRRVASGARERTHGLVFNYILGVD